MNSNNNKGLVPLQAGLNHLTWSVLTVLVALFCLPGISSAEKIVVYSAVYPPYQIDHNGKLTGINTEIVRAIFQYSDIPFEIRYVPWSRAQKYVGDDGKRKGHI